MDIVVRIDEILKRYLMGRGLFLRRKNGVGHRTLERLLANHDEIDYIEILGG